MALAQIMRFNPTATAVQFDGDEDSFEAIKELLSKVSAIVPATANKTLSILHNGNRFHVQPGQWVCVFMGAVSVLDEQALRAAIGVS